MRLLFLTLMAAFWCGASAAVAMQDIQEVTTSKGMKFWLMEDHSLPIVTLRVEFSNSGSVYDPAGKEGLAHFATHLLDEGAGDMDSFAFNRALEDHAIHLNISANDDSVSLSLQTLSEFTKASFDLLALALHKPRYDDEAITRIRAQLIAELKQVQENPNYVASLAWKEAAFPEHPYKRPRIGTLASLAAITRGDIQQFHNTRLLCGKKILSLTGDITASQASSLLEAMFPETKCPAPEASIADTDVRVADGGTPILVKKPVPQTVIQASVPAIPRSDPRYYALVVLNQIVGGGTLTGRLGKEIRIQRGLAYYAESDIEFRDHAAFLGMRFATRNEQAKTAVDVFLHELSVLRDRGVTQAELDAAKQYLTGSFALNLDSQQSLNEYMISMQRYALGIDYLAKRNDIIGRVTLAEVNALAKELFSHVPLVVMVGQ